MPLRGETGPWPSTGVLLSARRWIGSRRGLREGRVAATGGHIPISSASPSISLCSLLIAVCGAAAASSSSAVRLGLARCVSFPVPPLSISHALPMSLPCPQPLLVAHAPSPLPPLSKPQAPCCCRCSPPPQTIA
ncbi:hypothetical protein B0T16DRAFT_421540 [Cercophora newfieldiana]|uniref:Uncharacterized protein n=1 Tax=Cercophora newfieldiana TaxID=92897 RepID=A0AA39XR42_9PEZI|nr:hypothetical protein B0T16DRAFT_421540 [Cercophora newfieldiana]